MIKGEIWLVDLEPTVGAEMRKTRPSVIVSDDTVGRLPLKVIIPITDWKERYADADWMVRLEPTVESGLSKNSAADAFQVRSVSQKRFIQRLGKLSDKKMVEVSKALANALGLELKEGN